MIKWKLVLRKKIININDIEKLINFELYKSIVDQAVKVDVPSVKLIWRGEPLLHPRLKQVLELIRKSWPNTLIRVITNGYLLRRYDPEMWFTFGSLEMQVSVHRQDHEPIITKEIKRIVKCRDTWS